MAVNDFLPSREADLLSWSANFDALITADPLIYGLDAAQAAAYAALHAAYAAAFQAASDPKTRTPSAIQTKKDAKRALVAEARRLVKIIQAFPGTTNTMRSDLGITIRDSEPTPAPMPGEPPRIDIVNVYGRSLTVRLRDRANPTRRARPAGVIGATILSAVGDAPPQSVAGWKLEGNTGRSMHTVAFPETVAPGTKVWLTAFWINRRLQSGPAATPISRYIEFNGLAQAA